MWFDILGFPHEELFDAHNASASSVLGNSRTQLLVHIGHANPTGCDSKIDDYEMMSDLLTKDWKENKCEKYPKTPQRGRLLPGIVCTAHG